MLVLVRQYSILLAFMLLPGPTQGQSKLILQDSFRPQRFWTIVGTGAAIYTATVIGLNETWYKDHEKSRFHFFNDWKEWQNMDKMGHSFTTYFESELCYRGALWTGMNTRQAIWAGTGVALLLQSTVEILDGFSSKWGFSIYDMGYNIAGAALFGVQEIMWQDQRFRLKISSTQRTYSNSMIYSSGGSSRSSLANRSDALFGEGFMERYLKDYNAQTIWLSCHVNSLLKLKKWPIWLNLALGYGSENLFGGFQNTWTEDQESYTLNEDDFPRFRQWYLSPDIDLTKIKTDNKLLKTALRILNVFKFPAPALEVNGQGKFIFHWIHL